MLILEPHNLSRFVVDGPYGGLRHYTKKLHTFLLLVFHSLQTYVKEKIVTNLPALLEMHCGAPRGVGQFPTYSRHYVTTSHDFQVKITNVRSLPL